MEFKTIDAPATSSKPELYATLHESAVALFSGERNAIANAANLSALIWHSLPDLNWAGFYLWSGKDLVLGPFQGKIACVRIDLDRGVCGRAASERKTQVVADVHAFPGHIACDPDSRSEIVVPLTLGERLLGVLDLDSPHTDRFDAVDAQGLEALVLAWISASDHP
jgi:L-methionine (R)-S-oxide reductase